MKKSCLLALTVLLTSCSLPTLIPEASQVKFTADQASLKNCKYLGDVIGTAGHWYDFLYISNHDLMQGALDDLRNNAAAKGADIIYLEQPHSFSTSVTLLGIAYDCKHMSPGK